MRILVVEDDPNKRRQLLALLATEYPHTETETSISLIGALRKAISVKPDIVILDMTLPNYDNDGAAGMHAFGGEEFLRQVARRGLSPKVIIFTQFETFGEGSAQKDRRELERSLSRDFPALYRGFVYYNAALTGWTKHLLQCIDSTIREDHI